ncbi:MAG: hypothetical protein SWJ54_13780 [Cyanobacteriota bacterium]|nr:hypothetical protein [Cyanobacteriota bacterium]
MIIEDLKHISDVSTTQISGGAFTFAWTEAETGGLGFSTSRVKLTAFAFNFGQGVGSSAGSTAGSLGGYVSSRSVSISEA